MAQSALLTNTTISNNLESGNGAGIYVGYRAQAQEVTLVNCTVTENRAFKEMATGSLPDDRAGGIYVESDMDVLMYNTIAAWNFAGTGGGINSDLGVQLAVPHSGTIGGSSNLIGVAAPGSYTGAAIIINTSDPLLGALGYYGQQQTMRTHAPLSTSSAIDAGDNAVALTYGLDKDQRGLARPVDYYPTVGRPGTTIDIGAVELAFGEMYS